MTEEAIVLEVEGDTALLGCDHTGACTSCAGGSICNIKKRTFRAAVPPTITLRVGDAVEIYLPPGKTILAGFMVLMLPLILFFVGYILAGLITAAEGVRAVFGAAGLGLGFVVALLFRKTTERRQLPKITRIVENLPKAFPKLQI